MDIISLRKSFSFTEKHLEIAKKHLESRIKTFPHLFNNTEFKTLKFSGLDNIKIIDANLIERDEFGDGSSQAPRSTSTNPKYNELKSDMLEVGFKLYDKPIFVRRIGNGGKFGFLDGRTKDRILLELGVKNRICVIVEIDDSESQVYGNRLNAGEDMSPAGLVTSEDIFKLCDNYIKQGLIENNQKQIEDLINKACGTGKFTYQKRTIMATQIFHKWTSVMTGTLEPKAFRKSNEVKSWLEKNKYIETDTVKFLPYSSEAPTKAIIAAASEARLNPNKEIRVVVYLPFYKSYDAKKAYIMAMTNFKKVWYDTLSSVSSGYFNNASTKASNIVLYGYVPGNIEDVCEDMTKLVIIGKNDDNVNMDYYISQTTNSSLNQFFDTEDESDEIEV